MNNKPLSPGLLSEKSTAPTAVSRKTVWERAVELAISHGRSAEEASKSDWDQARRELKSQTISPPIATQPPAK